MNAPLYSNDEIERLFSVVRRRGGRIAGCPADAWWHLLFDLLIQLDVEPIDLITVPRSLFDLDLLREGTAERVRSLNRAGQATMLPWPRFRDRKQLDQLLLRMMRNAGMDLTGNAGFRRLQESLRKVRGE